MLPSKRPEGRFGGFAKLCAMSATISTVAACASVPATSTMMPIGSQTRPPPGLISLCEDAPDVCRPDTGKRENILANVLLEDSPTGSIELVSGVQKSETAPTGILRTRLTAWDEPKNFTLIEVRQGLRTFLPQEERRVIPELVEIRTRHTSADISSVWSNELIELSEVKSLTLTSMPPKPSFTWKERFEPVPRISTAVVVEPKSKPAPDWREVVRNVVANEQRSTSQNSISSRERLKNGSAITLSPQQFRKIDEINRRINAEITPKTDKEEYGKSEVWTLPLTFSTGRNGDCEDYAMEKRQALLKAGFPASSLYLAVGYSKATGKHAILVLSTTQGDYVLDNMTSEIKPWFQTGYSWISRQSSEDPLDWSNVNL